LLTDERKAQIDDEGSKSVIKMAIRFVDRFLDIGAYPSKK
jgi:hypothetical protein